MWRSIALMMTIPLVWSTGCGDEKKKRQAAQVARLAKMDCKDIAAKARRCDSAVRKAADEKQRQTGKKHLSLMVTLSLATFKDQPRCEKHVRQRVAFLKKDCKKYSGAADFCRLAQSRYLRGLKRLRKCFSSDDCDTIAACYLSAHPDIAP